MLLISLCFAFGVIFAVHGYVIYDHINYFNNETTPKLPVMRNSIPMLSVSLNMDKTNYLSRLLLSIDYPIDLICIQIGNSDPKIVQKIIEDIQFTRLQQPTLKIQVSTLNINPGSAKGFNFGLRNMMYSQDRPPWVLVVNNDIAFYPGVLQRINQHVYDAMISTPKFGIGFTSLCCGGEWSAVVFSRRMVEVVGYFDENFYPAYYEDDDYGIRVHLSSYQAVRFPNTAMLHGMIDGSKDYLSGLFSNLYLTKHLSPGEMAWKKAQEAGQVISKAYIEAKWKIVMPGFKDKFKSVDCKTVDGINGNCKVGVKTPYDDQSKSIADWVLNEAQFDSLITLANPSYP